MSLAEILLAAAVVTYFGCVAYVLIRWSIEE